jgi:hypothetical protein
LDIVGAVKMVTCSHAMIKSEDHAPGRWLGIPGCNRNMAWPVKTVIWDGAVIEGEQNYWQMLGISGRDRNVALDIVGAVKMVSCSCAMIKGEDRAPGRWLGIPGHDRNVAWGGEDSNIQWCLDQERTRSHWKRQLEGP